MQESNGGDRRAPDRLIAIGLSPRAAARLAAALAPPDAAAPEVVDATAWSEADLDRLHCGADDVAAAGSAAPEALERVRALRRRHPELPVLGLAPRNEEGAVAALLRAGAHEVGATPARLARLLRRARARTAAPPRRPRRSARSSASSRTSSTGSGSSGSPKTGR